MIKAVGFDWGGVIAGEPGSVFEKKACQLLNVSLEEFKKTYFSMNHLANNGILMWSEFWVQFLVNIDRSDRRDDFLTLVKEMHSKEPNRNMVELVKELKQNKYKVGLLSNNSRDAVPIFQKYGMYELFHTVVISGEIGMSKPDPHIFSLFTQKLRVEPAELIFIDDSETSLSRASEVGFIPLLFTNFELLKEDLEKFGVL